MGSRESENAVGKGATNGLLFKELSNEQVNVIDKNKVGEGDHSGRACVEEVEFRTLSIVNLHEVEIDDDHPTKEVAEYCLPLVEIMFQGQTNTHGDCDEANTCDESHLGFHLKLIHEFLAKLGNVGDFTGEEDEYEELLKMAATRRSKEGEATQNCYRRLKNDSKRFVEIYRERAMKSQNLETEAFWGTRQQLLAGKVIADWVDKERGPLDPMFGVLLNPTAGRVGAGDSGWLHDMLFDDVGYMAYHSAVHDAFGYLNKHHNVGPGYDYMKDSLLDTDNPMSGQLSGINFWKKVVRQVEKKQAIIKYMTL